MSVPFDGFGRTLHFFTPSPYFCHIPALYSFQRNLLMLCKGKKAMGNRKNIMIVDCQTEITEPLQAKLQQGGYLVACVANGLDAITRFRQGVFDLVLTDINLPGLNGNLLARYLRNISPATTIIAVTASPGLANDVFDLVVEKPFEAQFLVDSIVYCGDSRSQQPEWVERAAAQANVCRFRL